MSMSSVTIEKGRRTSLIANKVFGTIIDIAGSSRGVHILVFIMDGGKELWEAAEFMYRQYRIVVTVLLPYHTEGNEIT